MENQMNNTVLGTIKHKLGIEIDEITHFDEQIIMSINSALTIAYQIGAIPNPVRITDGTETWDYILGNSLDIDLLKDYIYLRVKKLFDPPQNGTLMTAIDNQIKEFEWRINTMVETRGV